MSNYILYNKTLPDDHLYHYGVRGMKWGIRRYQNSDGTRTAEGKKRAKQEYKADNKTAYELGKIATVSGHAAARSLKRTIKIENKLDKRFEKDPEGLKGRTRKLHKKWAASSQTSAQLVNNYMKNKAAAEQHCKSLIDKYGAEAVEPIKYANIKLPKGQHSPASFQTMNERTNKVSKYVAAGAASAAVSAGLSAMANTPIIGLMYPKSARQKGNQIEQAVYRSNLERNG